MVVVVIVVIEVVVIEVMVVVAVILLKTIFSYFRLSQHCRSMHIVLKNDLWRSKEFSTICYHTRVQ